MITELIKKDRAHAYPLYELKFPGLSPEGNFDGNFARVKIEGDYRKRICSIEVYDELGIETFNKRIHQTEISYSGIDLYQSMINAETDTAYGYWWVYATDGNSVLNSINGPSSLKIIIDQKIV